MELSFVNRVGEGGPSRIGFQERWWIVGSRKSGSLGNLGCSYTRLISLYPPECNAGTRALEGVKNGRERREGKRYPIVNVRHGNNEEKVGGEKLGFSCFVKYVGLVRGVADMQSS